MIANIQVGVFMNLGKQKLQLIWKREGKGSTRMGWKDTADSRAALGFFWLMSGGR